MKNKHYSILTLIVVFLTLAGSVVFTACEKEDENLDTNQMGSTEIKLNSFGPSPAMRGGELRFIGTNLDRVTSIDIPGANGITDITVVSQNEIRITIPQTAVPGLVKLTTPTGEISTTTPLSYLEPISIDSFEPATIKAGQTLKVTGGYLNNVEEVIFFDGVHVLKKDFVSQSREALELKVPEAAQTGKFIVSDGADLLSDGEEIPTWIYSASDLTVTLPSISEISPNPVKAGTLLTIKGADLDLVKSIVFGGDQAVDTFTTQSATQIELVVPLNAIDGMIDLIPASGVKVTSASDLVMVVPTAAIEDMKASYGVDETVVIAGTDLDLITTATFTGVEATPVTLTDGKLELKVTAADQSGPIILAMANGTTVTVDGFVTTKPEATLPSDATPLDELNIVSTLGNRVTTVMFGDLEAEATATGNGFQVIVPLEAETGDVTLVMDNGETIAAGSIVINAYTFCAVSEFASEETTVGTLLECSVLNGENLTNVLLNDANTQYLLVGTVLYVSVGVSVGDNKLTLVSGTTNVDYVIKVAASGLVETVLYNTPLELANWSKNFELNVDFSGAPADSYVRIRYTKTNDNPQMKVFDGHWGNVYDGTTAENAAILAASDYIDLPMSLFPYSDWGYSIILQGDGMIVSSISWVKDFSPPTAIWEGSFDIGSWQGNQDLAWGGYDWSTVKAGQTLYFTFTMNAGNDWGCLSLRHGTGWGNLPTEGSGQIDYGPSDTQGTYTLTQADVDDLVANGGLVITGANLTLTQVALK